MGQTDSGGNGFPLQRRPLQAKRVIGDNGTPVDTINSLLESRNAKKSELSLFEDINSFFDLRSWKIGLLRPTALIRFVLFPRLLPSAVAFFVSVLRGFCAVRVVRSLPASLPAFLPRSQPWPWTPPLLPRRQTERRPFLRSGTAPDTAAAAQFCVAKKYTCLSRIKLRGEAIKRNSRIYIRRENE